MGEDRRVQAGAVPKGMLKFAIIALPRSGTTWAANWLSTRTFHVKHDPLYSAHYMDWGRLYDAVSCTGIWRWPRWVYGYPCKKLILHRPLAEVNASLASIGFPEISEEKAATLKELKGDDIMHLDHKALFDPEAAKAIWRWLDHPGTFDAAWHAELVRMRITPDMPRILAEAPVDLMERLSKELDDGEKIRV